MHDVDACGYSALQTSSDQRGPREGNERSVNKREHVASSMPFSLNIGDCEDDP
jgi:hypothetical protein